jgi:hypothetical protein
MSSIKERIKMFEKNKSADEKPIPQNSMKKGKGKKSPPKAPSFLTKKVEKPPPCIASTAEGVNRRMSGVGDFIKKNPQSNAGGSSTSSATSSSAIANPPPLPPPCTAVTTEVVKRRVSGVGDFMKKNPQSNAGGSSTSSATSPSATFPSATSSPTIPTQAEEAKQQQQQAATASLKKEHKETIKMKVEKDVKEDRILEEEKEEAAEKAKVEKAAATTTTTKVKDSRPKSVPAKKTTKLANFLNKKNAGVGVLSSASTTTKTTKAASSVTPSSSSVSEKTSELAKFMAKKKVIPEKKDSFTTTTTTTTRSSTGSISKKRNKVAAMLAKASSPNTPSTSTSETNTRIKKSSKKGGGKISALAGKLNFGVGGISPFGRGPMMRSPASTPSGGGLRRAYSSPNGDSSDGSGSAHVRNRSQSLTTPTSSSVVSPSLVHATMNRPTLPRRRTPNSGNRRSVRRPKSLRVTKKDMISQMKK